MKVCTERPPSSYTASTSVESRLRAVLPFVKTEAEAQTIFKDYLRQEAGGTKEGEDFDHYLTSICQMANNGGWSEEGTQRLIAQYWDVKRADPKAEHVRQTSIAGREGRAWLTVKTLVLCKDTGQTAGCISPSIEDNRRFKVDFGNSGKTPALKAFIRFCVRAQLPEEIDHEWIRRECSTTKETSILVVAPDLTITMSSFANDKRTLSTQNVPLFAFGLIEYDDVYKVPHWTAFCFISPHAKTIDTAACAQPNSNTVDNN